MSNLKEIAMAAKAAAANATTSVPAKGPKISAEEIERRRQRQKSLLVSLAEELVELTDVKTREAAEKGHGYTKVAEYFLPGFDKQEHENEIVAVPRNPPELTHWAGRGVDPTKDGVPIVMLLQGVREQTKSGPRLRPDLLPGGKTAWQLAQSMLDERDHDARLDFSFNSKRKSLIITAIWIDEDWQRFLSRRQDRRPTDRSGSALGSYQKDVRRPARPAAAAAEKQEPKQDPESKE
jgi:hypothetical protein